MTEADVVIKVRAFLTRSFPHLFRDIEFGDQTNLLGRGGLDSMALMELVTFLEDEFEISVPERDIRTTNLETLTVIGAYVCRRKAATAC